MTANAMQGDRDRCMAAGMNDHVPKPIEPEDLWKALLKWIKPRQPPAATGVAQPEPAPSRTQEVELPSAIDAVDMVTGLRRALGKKPLYLSMLRKFEAGQAAALEDIQSELDSPDWGDAERRAHTLKGVAGNIGAAGLQRQAEGIETAIRERRPREEVDAMLDELRNPLASLIAQLHQTLPKKADRTTVSVSRPELKAVLDQLETLLIANDSDVLDFLDSNADLLYTAFPEHYPAIADAIRSVDFDKALAALRAGVENSI
jgi:two-component system sensor histidine kinase/response regulator